jgi:hypothetical protein
VRAYQLLVADERQRVPDLLIVFACDEARAREIAQRVLAESRHFRTVEVLEHGLPIFSIDKADPRRA